MLAKVIAHGADRECALAALENALRETIVAGMPTNTGWLLNVLADDEMRAGRPNTALAAHVATPELDRANMLAAATAWTLEQPNQADVWAAIGPFRLKRPLALTFHGDDWEDRVVLARVGVEWRLMIDAAESSLRWSRDAFGIWTILHGDSLSKAAMVEHPGALEIVTGCGRWMVQRGPRATTPASARTWVGDGSVLAPLTARVLEVAVAPGDRVEVGQRLVTLEAMKMEFACPAPAPGVVTRVHCQPGDIVEAGTRLAWLLLDALNEDLQRQA
jgi:acetyl/propionyl-CoA carboxylase alpha subunit